MTKCNSERVWCNACRQTHEKLHILDLKYTVIDATTLAFMKNLYDDILNQNKMLVQSEFCVKLCL